MKIWCRVEITPSPPPSNTYIIFCSESVLHIIVTISNPFVVAFPRVDIGHINRQHLGNEVRLIETTVRNRGISHGLRSADYNFHHTVEMGKLDYHMCRSLLDPWCIILLFMRTCYQGYKNTGLRRS